MDIELFNNIWEFITRKETWELITRKETGLLALVIALFGLAKTWWEIKKLRRENDNLCRQSSKLTLDIEVLERKLPLEIAKLSAESGKASHEFLILRENRSEIIECLNSIKENTNKSWNDLWESYWPILSGKILRTDRKKRLADIERFAARQDYRQNIDNALKRLGGLAEGRNVPVITDLLKNVDAFCHALSDDQCFLHEIRKELTENGQLSLELSRQIQNWQNIVKELRGDVTTAAGWAQGRVEKGGWA